MAAKAAQERVGLRQSAQLVGAGAPVRLRRDVLRHNTAFRVCRIRVRDVCRFTVLRVPELRSTVESYRDLRCSRGVPRMLNEMV